MMCENLNSQKIDINADFHHVWNGIVHEFYFPKSWDPYVVECDKIMKLFLNKSIDNKRRGWLINSIKKTIRASLAKPSISQPSQKSKMIIESKPKTINKVHISSKIKIEHQHLSSKIQKKLIFIIIEKMENQHFTFQSTGLKIKWKKSWSYLLTDH